MEKIISKQSGRLFVTHYLEAERAEGWQGALSRAETDVLGNSQSTGSRLVCVQRFGQVC